MGFVCDREESVIGSREIWEKEGTHSRALSQSVSQSVSSKKRQVFYMPCSFYSFHFFPEYSKLLSVCVCVCFSFIFSCFSSRAATEEKKKKERRVSLSHFHSIHACPIQRAKLEKERADKRY